MDLGALRLRRAILSEEHWSEATVGSAHRRQPWDEERAGDRALPPSPSPWRSRLRFLKEDHRTSRKNASSCGELEGFLERRGQMGQRRGSGGQ